MSGLDKLISKRTGIPVYVAEEAISCVAIGTGQALEHIDILQDSDINTNRKIITLNY